MKKVNDPRHPEGFYLYPESPQDQATIETHFPHLQMQSDGSGEFFECLLKQGYSEDEAASMTQRYFLDGAFD